MKFLKKIQPKTNNPKASRESNEMNVQDPVQMGRQWQADRYESAMVERNRYFVMLLVALLVIVAQAILVMNLFPLKKTQPYVIEVDYTKGLATILEPMNRSLMNKDQVLRTFFLNRYLEARMSYQSSLLSYHKELVRSMSDAATYRQYAETLSLNNPDSLTNKLGNQYDVKASIVEYHYPYPDTTEIRFYTEAINRNSGKAGEKEYYTAVLKYDYADAAMNLRDREKYNPLGLFVTGFQISKVKTPN